MSQTSIKGSKYRVFGWIKLSRPKDLILTELLLKSGVFDVNRPWCFKILPVG